ncbi:MAG: hypothetical protein WCP70_12870, partial [Methanothrix sp.]
AAVTKIQPPEKLSTPARLFLALRPDRPPAPECERVHMRARLADGAIVSGWPLPRNDSTDAARGFWRKIVLLSSELRAYSAFA